MIGGKFKTNRYFYIKFRMMIVFPKAKINIGLRITGKCPDGYHDIETVFYPVGLSDALEYIIPDQSLREDDLTVTGLNTGGPSEDNLVIKILSKLRRNYTLPWLKIHLHKAIPAGAGLGGGSSDAACFLKSVIKSFGLKIDRSAINAIALETGSDCPFFIDYIPAYATGRGEQLTPMEPVLKDYYLLLLNPGISINTREAYNNSSPEIPESNLSDLVNLPIEKWKDKIINDFEDFAFRRHPMLGDIKNELYRAGAIFSSMSGSGSSIYGIFRNKPQIPEKLNGFLIYEGLL
jgi:4-diphosphocytidyl-2-C-methyl-D-erythritol kinase